MYKTRIIAFAVLVILLNGLMSGVIAQKKAISKPVDIGQPLPIPVALSGSYYMQVNAGQLSAGDVEYGTDMSRGWTCYGTTDGDLTGFMFVSMNFTSPSESPKDGGGSKVTGGSWSKLIFAKEQYIGSVSGRIVEGMVTWNGPGLPANISLQLTATSGTELFVSSKGTGTFEGLWDRSLRKPSVVGVLTLNY